MQWHNIFAPAFRAPVKTCCQKPGWAGQLYMYFPGCLICISPILLTVFLRFLKAYFSWKICARIQSSGEDLLWEAGLVRHLYMYFPGCLNCISPILLSVFLRFLEAYFSCNFCARIQSSGVNLLWEAGLVRAGFWPDLPPAALPATRGPACNPYTSYK